MTTPTARVRTLKRARWWLRNRGWDVVRYSGGIAAVQQTLLAEHGIDLLLDVGANEGQYARELRLRGYAGDILSVEPGTTAFERLGAQARQDGRWRTVRAAIDAESGSGRLGVSANLQSSSLLAPSRSHLDAEPSVAYTEYETVPLHRLDDLDAPGERLWLKLDCQGSEARVLDGGAQTLARTRVVQCEMSLRPMYDGEATIADLVPRFVALGFEPWWISPGFHDPQTGAALQVDTIFSRVSDPTSR